MRLIHLLLATAVAMPGVMPATTQSCAEDVGQWGSTCTYTNSGEQVDVGATFPAQGTQGANSTGEKPQPAPAPSPSPSRNDGNICTDGICRPAYTIEAPPDVTVEDLVSFRPAAPTLTGEPAGFAVVDLPANVVAAASVQHLTGELLGWDVTVRFTPAAYVFDYGDGTVARSATGGATWASSGQAQFTPTATSHTYRSRGTFAVTARVLYSAAVDFGTGSWRPVPGFVTASSGGYAVEVLEARTALVERTCLEDPRGPGC